MNWIRIISLVTLVGLIGCSSTAPVRPTPGPRPLGSSLVRGGDPTLADPDDEKVDAPRPSPTLTLEGALRLALRHSPALASATWELRAAEARVRQAGLLPNPELEVEVEEFGGGRERAGFGGSEGALVIAQALPLGGRLGESRRVASMARESAGWQHEATRLEVYANTVRAFHAVLAAQERLGLGRETVELGESVLRSVTEQVDAGKVAPLEASKARVELSLLRLRRDRLARELDARRRELAAVWGSSDPGLERVEGRLDRLGTVPSEDRVMALFGENPEIAGMAAEFAMHEAELGLARAEGIPDLVVSAGVLHFTETHEQAFLAGVSIDLPLFDRNQGGVAEARANLRKARAERKAATVRVRIELSDAHRELVLATGQARTLRDEVVPTARAAFTAAQVGFREGKNGLLEMLDAQRTLVDVQGELVDALEAHHAAAVEVERLVGRSLDRLDGESEEGGDVGPSNPDAARKESPDAR